LFSIMNRLSLNLQNLCTRLSNWGGQNTNSRQVIGKACTQTCISSTPGANMCSQICSFGTRVKIFFFFVALNVLNINNCKEVNFQKITCRKYTLIKYIHI
jgi:hypothetical protein